MGLFTDIDQITNPSLVLTSVLFACSQVWDIDEDAIGREIMAATDGGNLWAPDACRALHVHGVSQEALELAHGRAMGELCETMNAIVALFVARHPEAWFRRSADEVNEFVLGFARRLAA